MDDCTPEQHLPTKRCGKCKEIKAVSAFSKNAKRKDGLQERCKACAASYYVANREALSARRAAYYIENRERIMAKSAAYYSANREEIAAHRAQFYIKYREKIAASQAAYYIAHRAERAAYYASHRAKIRAYNVAYLDAHRDEQAARTAAWKKANPDKVRANYHRRRARKLGNSGTHTAQDIQRQGDSQKWRCWWCGKNCADKYHVDHLIPLSKGGHNNPSNIVISCPRCNCSKHDKTPDEFCDRLL